MYNMLIVDDFHIDRINVEQCIDWNNIGINILSQASHGKEALEICESQSIDIILTDVQMPFMDGIELAREVSERYPHIKIVFMSYYNDFEYLKSAIDLNAYGYILKPYVPEEVSKTFLKVVRLWEKENKLQRLLNESRPLLINQFYKNILLGNIKESEMILRRAKFLNQTIEEGFYQSIVFNIDEQAFEKAVEIEESYLRAISLHEKLVEMTQDLSGSEIIPVDDYHVVLLLFGHTYEEIIQVSYSFIEEIKEDWLDNIQVSISSIKEGLDQIQVLYEECLIGLKYKFYYSSNEFIYYESMLQNHNSQQEYRKVDEILERTRIVINRDSDGDMEDFINYLLPHDHKGNNEDYYRSIAQTFMMTLEMVLVEQGLSVNRLFKKSLTDLLIELRQCHKIGEIRTYIKNTVGQVSTRLSAKKHKSGAKLVSQVKDFVAKNYMKDITVKDVATQFYYSPNYLNTLFRKEMGKSIPDYITGYRIGKAKELLKHGDLKVYEVIEAVGYKRASYFNSIFKRYTGMTPKEYRGTL